MTFKITARWGKKRFWLALLVLPWVCVCIGITFSISIQIYIHMTARLVATATSFDGKYHADLYAYAPILPTVSMPGDGGPEWDDGYAMVYDSSGNLICEAPVPYAGQGFERGSIFWDTYRNHKVYIKDYSCSLP